MRVAVLAGDPGSRSDGTQCEGKVAVTWAHRACGSCLKMESDGRSEPFGESSTILEPLEQESGRVKTSCERRSSSATEMISGLVPGVRLREFALFCSPRFRHLAEQVIQFLLEAFHVEIEGRSDVQGNQLRDN